MSPWIRRGDLVLLHPGVLALPERAAEWPVRARAATLWARGPLSYLSALTAAGLAASSDGPIHVTVPTHRFPRGVADVIAHRSDRRQVTVRFGRVEALTPLRSLVDAWAWASAPVRNPHAAQETALVRAAVIDGVRSHGIRPLAVRRESDQRPLHAGRAALLVLLNLITSGCESELEIWGATKVLPGPPDVPAPVQQFPIRLADGRWVRADAAYPDARVIVEMDGAAFHGSQAARERDIRRDTALAALGWVVLRFSYARLMADPEGCRREIASVVRGRLAHR